MEENEKRRNVELAYLSLMLSGKKVSECELASEVLKISRAKGEKSLAMLVQSSIKITVKVLSVVLEEAFPRRLMRQKVQTSLSAHKTFTLKKAAPTQANSRQICSPKQA